jgi:hypothetical protein
MSNHRLLSGSDYMMLGFDHELRRQGYAGNSCYIILELNSAISPDALHQRLEKIAAHCPVLNARAGGIFRRQWKLPKNPVAPKVRVHREQSEILENLLNNPLDPKNGELMRFDLIECADGKMKIIFTWAHALMDAHSAEHFVAVVGREDLPLPASEFLPIKRAPLAFREKLKRAWKNFLVFHEFRKIAPRSPGKRHKVAPPRLQFRVEKFSAAETAQVRANAVKLSGALGETQFHTAVATIEFHQTLQRLGCPSPSYILPVPVNMRPKGNVEPLFSNQITMLLLQLLPEQLSSTGNVIAQIKTQTAHAMREGIVEGGIFFLNALRVLPLPIYVAFARFGFKGEICSLFYGNTAVISPLITNFLGATIEDFTHVAATPVSPGAGIIFYQFRGELRITLMHAAEVLDKNEAAQFASAVRARLLNP